MTNTQIYSPVHYVMSERSRLEKDRLVIYVPGWYFWEQDWSYRNGPFKTKIEAEDAHAKRP